MTAIEERYARATRSSHLELKRTDEAPGDVDTVIAAGTAEHVGILLTRLRLEWDTVSKRELAQAGTSGTARVLTLMGLRSLDRAKQTLLLFAVRQAPHKACDSGPEAIHALVVQVLQVWLDKLCYPCDGRGFSGGYGKARVMCSKCGGTGSRRNSKLGQTPAEHIFGLWLLGMMDSRCSGSMKQISRKTRQG